MSAREGIEKRLEEYGKWCEDRDLWPERNVIGKCIRIVREEFDRSKAEPTIPLSVVEAALEAGRMLREGYINPNFSPVDGARMALTAIEDKLKPALYSIQPPKVGERWRMKGTLGFEINVFQVSTGTVFGRPHPLDDELTTLTASLKGFTDRWERVEAPTDAAEGLTAGSDGG